MYVMRAVLHVQEAFAIHVVLLEGLPVELRRARAPNIYSNTKRCWPDSLLPSQASVGQDRLSPTVWFTAAGNVLHLSLTASFEGFGLQHPSILLDIDGSFSTLPQPGLRHGPNQQHAHASADVR